MKCHERNEDAVSPVLGVMLMIVVTIVIAAVVTAFATGMTGDSTATTPMALFDAENQQMTKIQVDEELDGTPIYESVLKSFDIVHKGGDEVAQENIQVTIEPSGSDSSYGILMVRKSTDLSFLGGDILTTGNRIRITLNYNSDNERVLVGDLVKWTLSDTRTNGVIAKGEFVVPKA